MSVSIPDGDSFLREVADAPQYADGFDVSIPDGDSFLREAKTIATWSWVRKFQSPMGIVSSAKAHILCAAIMARLGFNPRWG